MTLETKPEKSPMIENTPKLTLAKSPLLLDLACGQNVKQGFEGVDLWAPNATHKVDLMKFPWPFENDSCSELHCSHFIEHIPLRNVETRDIIDAKGDIYFDEDMLFAFFDECYRILRFDGTMLVICPSVRNERAFQDPTHRRFITQATFFYLDNDWRKANGLDHYKVHSSWLGNVNFSMMQETALLHPEAQQRKFISDWNVIFDYNAVLKPKKEAPKKA